MLVYQRVNGDLTREKTGNEPPKMATFWVGQWIDDFRTIFKQAVQNSFGD